MSIGMFCKRNVVCASRDTTIVEAAHLMRRNHVGDVVVIDEMDEGRRPIGPGRIVRACDSRTAARSPDARVIGAAGAPSDGG